MHVTILCITNYKILMLADNLINWWYTKSLHIAPWSDICRNFHQVANASKHYTEIFTSLQMLTIICRNFHQLTNATKQLHSFSLVNANKNLDTFSHANKHLKTFSQTSKFKLTSIRFCINFYQFANANKHYAQIFTN